MVTSHDSFLPFLKSFQNGLKQRCVLTAQVKESLFQTVSCCIDIYYSEIRMNSEEGPSRRNSNSSKKAERAKFQIKTEKSRSYKLIFSSRVR